MFDTTEMGALFKKFRLSKKLTLKDVAGDFYRSLFYLNLNGVNQKSPCRAFSSCLKGWM
ncbi:hypothetical protein CIRMBP1320_00276 [Enterococcus cecorum]|nr:hypothetical protein CIRMBP1320_00276 [Enterococcus cecorum]